MLARRLAHSFVLLLLIQAVAPLADAFQLYGQYAEGYTCSLAINSLECTTELDVDKDTFHFEQELLSDDCSGCVSCYHCHTCHIYMYFLKEFTLSFYSINIKPNSFNLSGEVGVITSLERPPRQ